MKATFKDHALKSLQQAKDCYAKDLKAMQEGQITESCGGSARSACDFSYEVAVVNHRILARMKGEDPGAWPFADGWAVAPEDYRSVSAIATNVDDSIKSMMSLIESFDEDKITEKFTVPGQTEETSIGELAVFASMHIMYHAAQLNFIQSLAGDLEVHWH